MKPFSLIIQINPPTTADWHYYISSQLSPHIHSQNASHQVHLPAVIDDILPSTHVPPPSPSPHDSPIMLLLSHYINYNNISTNHASFISSLQTTPEPTTYDEASKHDCWNQAMQVELLALEKTGTWDIVDLPAYVKPIGC